MSSSSEDERQKKHKKKSKKHKLHKQSDSSDEDRKKRKKEKKETKRLKKQMKKEKKLQKIKELATKLTVENEKKTSKNKKDDLNIPVHLMEKSKSMAPMTKDEWDKKQSVVRKVYDEASGRHRLIKGDGEVIEEMVSKERHKAINQQATKGDGEYFQSKLLTKK